VLVPDELPPEPDDDDPEDDEPEDDEPEDDEPEDDEPEDDEPEDDEGAAVAADPDPDPVDEELPCTGATAEDSALAEAVDDVDVW
jgi:serine protease